MLEHPMDVLTAFPVRKSKAQKQAFRDAVQSYAASLGYESHVERGGFGVRNLVIGDPEGAKCLITAHYDTCARMPFPNYTTPCNLWFYWSFQLLVTAAILLLVLLATLAVDFLTANQVLGAVAGYATLAGVLLWLTAGPQNTRNANDNTSGVVTVLEIARSLPEGQRSKVCFVLFDLEEAGLLGSSAYRQTHKRATDTQIVVNLDCVGDGDHLRMFPTKALRKDRPALTSLYKACGYFGKKSLLVQERGFYPSDQMNFPLGVGVCALRPGKFGLCLGNIHTPRDTVLEQTNVNLLRAALTTWICCGAAQ